MKTRIRQQTKYWMISATVTVAVLATVIAETTSDKTRGPAPSGISSGHMHQQPAELIGYYRSIVLTPEQEAIKQAALSAIPAPCCSNYSIATCCCPCNLAKSVWGLAQFLIAQRGYSVRQTQASIGTWLAASNPAGYSGNACSTGGCSRPFDHDGCGGMDEEHVL